MAAPLARDSSTQIKPSPTFPAPPRILAYQTEEEIVQAVPPYTGTLQRVAIGTAHLKRKRSLEVPAASSITGLNRYVSKRSPGGYALDWSAISSGGSPYKTGHDPAVRLSAEFSLLLPIPPPGR